MNGHLLDVLEVQPRCAPRWDAAVALRRCLQLLVHGVLLCLAVASFLGLMWFCMWCAVYHRALVPYVAVSLIAAPLLAAVLACALSGHRAEGTR